MSQDNTCKICKRKLYEWSKDRELCGMCRRITNIETYRKNNNIEVKCISDRILLILRYGVDRICQYITSEKDEQQIKKICNDIYYNIVRANEKYTVRKQEAVAGGILWQTFIQTYTLKRDGNEIYYEMNNGKRIHSHDIISLFDATDTSIRKVVKLLQKDLGYIPPPINPKAVVPKEDPKIRRLRILKIRKSEIEEEIKELEDSLIK